MGSSLKGDHTSQQGTTGSNIEATDQGGDRDGPNNSVLLHIEFSGTALSALKLMRSLKAQIVCDRLIANPRSEGSTSQLAQKAVRSSSSENVHDG